MAKTAASTTFPVSDFTKAYVQYSALWLVLSHLTSPTTIIYKEYNNTPKPIKYDI